MSNNQRTNFVIDKITQFPLHSLLGAIALGGAIPWSDIGNWALSLLPVFGIQ